MSRLRRLLPVLIALGVAAGVAPAAVRAAGPVVKLGPGSAQDVTQGFGTVRPAEINYGGDGTSFVKGITWSSWGGAQAIGHGTATWVWPGWCNACASVSLPATVVAYDKESCGGSEVYGAVEWFFPTRGQSFRPTPGGNDLCPSITPPKVSYPKLVKCGGAPSLGGGVSARSVETLEYPAGCAAAKRFIASGPFGRYLGRSAKLHLGKWWCGSEIDPQSGVPQSFDCESGNVASISFELVRN